MTNLIRLNPLRWPYSLQQLREDEPSRSFSSNPTRPELAHYGVFVVRPQDPPTPDPAAYKVVEVQPIEDGGEWLQQWEVVALTPEEAEAYYRATHPPRWMEFWAALPPEVDSLLVALGEVKRGLEHGLVTGLSRAADGDSRVFLSTWHSARALGIIPAELVTGIQTLAVLHDLPADFVAGLGAEVQP